MPEIFRHGDLLLRKIESLPTSAQKLDTMTLAEGEATGHHHTFTAGQVQLYAPAQLTDDVAKYIEVKSKQASLTHQEHKQIDVPQGIWQLSIEREYSPVDRVVRQVLD